MKKWLFKIVKGYKTKVTFNSYCPSTGQDIPRSDYDVDFEIKTGAVYVAKTKKDALKAIAAHNAAGGEAILIN